MAASCRPTGEFVVTIGKSGRLYLERVGRWPTSRVPGPKLFLDANAVHTYPLATPLPLPSILLAHQDSLPPAAGITTPWPNGTEELWFG
jgi:hypothetical protein